MGSARGPHTPDSADAAAPCPWPCHAVSVQARARPTNSTAAHSASRGSGPNSSRRCPGPACSTLPVSILHRRDDHSLSACASLCLFSLSLSLSLSLFSGRPLFTARCLVRRSRPLDDEGNLAEARLPRPELTDSGPGQNTGMSAPTGAACQSSEVVGERDGTTIVSVVGGERGHGCFGAIHRLLSTLMPEGPERLSWVRCRPMMIDRTGRWMSVVTAIVQCSCACCCCSLTNCTQTGALPQTSPANSCVACTATFSRPPHYRRYRRRHQTGRSRPAPPLLSPLQLRAAAAAEPLPAGSAPAQRAATPR